MGRRNNLDGTLVHAVVAAYDRATGEVLWARLVQQSSTPDRSLAGLLFGSPSGGLELRLSGSGDIQVDGTLTSL